MKKIFKESHKLTKEMVEKYEVDYQAQFGLFVTYLVEESKKEVRLEVKQWFINKNFTQEERYVASVSDLTIIRETEKAVLIEFYSDFGKLNKWIPKSCLMTEEDFRKEEERQEKRVKRFEEGQRKYNELIEFAKENKVKGVRVGWRKETIINKIKDAGLDIPAELIA